MSSRPWTDEDDAALRERYGREPATGIAAALGRTTAAVYTRASLLGLRSDLSRSLRPSRLWNADQDAEIRAAYRTETAESIGRRLGRTASQVHRRAVKIGAAETRRAYTSEEVDAIRRLNAEGMSDSRIAARLGRDRHQVSHRRKAMWLPSHAHGEQARALIAAALKMQCERMGIVNPNDLRMRAWKRLSRERGWPETIGGRATNPRHVQILDLLYERGPQTRRGIAEAIGMRVDSVYGNVLPSNGPGGSYLAELIRAGLVVSLGRVVRDDGKGRNVAIYSLSLDVERRSRDEAEAVDG